MTLSKKSEAMKRFDLRFHHFCGRDAGIQGIDNSFPIPLDGSANQLEAIKDFISSLYDEYEDEVASCKILNARMDKWQKEWVAEKPEERLLITNDGLKLIEWKINQAYQQGVKDSLGKLLGGDQYEGDNIAHMEGYRKAIKESEANIKSLIE
jgi:hypothetical protein